MPRKKKEVTEDASVQSEEAESKQKAKDVVGSEKEQSKDNVLAQEGYDKSSKDASEEIIVLPINMIYKGKRYNVGDTLEGVDDEIVEALLVKLLGLIESEVE